MKSTQLLREQLLELLEGGHAHMDFDELIADFPMDHINDKAPDVPYSPWQLMEHMRIAQWDILQFIINPGHVSPEYPGGYRPRPDETADAAAWERTVKAFRADLDSLRRIVADPGSDLFGDLPHAEGYSILREILVAADHNSYHMGEIAMLRQVLGLWPEERPYLTG